MDKMEIGAIIFPDALISYQVLEFIDEHIVLRELKHGKPTGINTTVTLNSFEKMIKEGFVPEGSLVHMDTTARELAKAKDKEIFDSIKEQVNHPAHYNQHPSGVECIDVVEHFNFNIGNSVKYLWRAGLKDAKLQDLEKAKWYIEREIERLTKGK